jgi:hypothetical protein
MNEEKSYSAKVMREITAYLKMADEIKDNDKLDEDELSEEELAEIKLAEARAKARYSRLEKHKGVMNDQDLKEYIGGGKRQRVSDAIPDPETYCNICGDRWHTHDVCPYESITIALPTDDGFVRIYKMLFYWKVIMQIIHDGTTFRHWEYYDQVYTRIILNLKYGKRSSVELES